MASAKGMNSTKNHITRRAFVSGAIAIAGGLVMLSFPDRASASEGLAAANLAPAETNFVDSLGRTVSIAKPISSVVPLGIYAQTLMETLYPGALASLAKEVSDDADDFAESGLADIVALVETGTTKANFGKDVDFARIAALAPDVVLQAGIPRAGVTEELEQVQPETGAPCVFLDISFGKLQESYRTLGHLLGCEERAEELACYIEDIQARAVSTMPSDELKPRVFYGPRVAGRKVTDGVVVQLNVISQLGMDPVTRPYDFEGRTVDFILLDDTSFPAEFFSCEGEVHQLWKGIRAISEGRFAVAPALMHSILGSALFAQSIGMLWITSVVAPSHFKYDMAAEMARYYRLFYGLERDEVAMARLLGMAVEDE